MELLGLRIASWRTRQFSLPVNVQLSLYGVDFLKHGLQKLCEGRVVRGVTCSGGVTVPKFGLRGIDVDTDVQFKDIT